MKNLWAETKKFLLGIYAELRGHLKTVIVGLVLAAMAGTAAGEATGTFEPVSGGLEVVGAKESNEESLLKEILAKLNADIEPRIKDLEDARIRVTEGSLGDDCSGRNLPYVHFTDVTIDRGPSFTYAGEIRGTTSSRIAIGTLTVTDGRFPNFNVSSSTIHVLTATSPKTDGYDLDSLGVSTTTAVSIISTEPGWAFSGEAEHAILSAQLSDCQINEVLLTDIDSNGDWLIEYVDIGTLNFIRGEYGDGDGPSLSDLSLADNVSVGTVTISGITVEAVNVQ
jgi:hypothetical protein